VPLAWLCAAADNGHGAAARGGSRQPGGRQPGLALRAVAAQQAKAWLDRAHGVAMESATAMLDGEKWAPAQLAPELPAILTRFVGACVTAAGSRHTALTD
jgi:hypothetical protein